MNRRTWLILAGQAAGALAVPAGSRADSPATPPGVDESLVIVRSRRPLDVETPVTALDPYLTPNDRFFIRSHLGAPLVRDEPWDVRVGGLVARDLRLTADDLGRFPRVTVPAVLQCSGNGRAFFRPTIPGLAWERGAVGHAEWTGVRLADVLDHAGVKPGAAHVHFLGADSPPSPKTPMYLRSLLLDRARDASTLLATAMNGEPLPWHHGGPLRLVVPGWSGNHWMKWVRWVTVSSEEAPGFYMQTAYKMPRTPMPPSATPKPSDLVPMTVLNVKSLITHPAEGSPLKAGRVEVRGVAWTGDGHVERVEIASSRTPGVWRAADLIDPPRPGSWRRFRAVIEASERGPLTVRSRATDSAGKVQPDETPWNRSGYLWNAIDEVTVRVG